MARVRPVPVGACRLQLGSDPCLSGRVAYSWGQTLAFRGVSPTAGVRPLPFGACRLQLGPDPCGTQEDRHYGGQFPETAGAPGLISARNGRLQRVAQAF